MAEVRVYLISHIGSSIALDVRVRDRVPSWTSLGGFDTIRGHVKVKLAALDRMKFTRSAEGGIDI